MSIDWIEYKLEELLAYEQPTAYIVNSTDYNDNYKTPVLTAGKSFIIGYTDETTGIYNKLPVIIFDDFTTASQYVNFQFKVKSSAMKILTANPELVLPKFIFYRMQTIQFNHDTHKRYWIQQYSQIKVKVPPLPEQERIVAKIEELFSQLDAAIAELKSVKEKLVIYRQAVLEDSFKGKYPLKRLEEISKAISGYAFKSSLYSPTGKYTIVKIGNVKSFSLDFSRDLSRTDEDSGKTFTDIQLRKGDCLITMTGSRGKRDYGFVAMIEEQENFVLNQRVALLRFQQKYAIPKFYQYYLSSHSFRDIFFSYETGNVGQGNVGIKALREPLVILPTLEQQNDIVESIEQKLSVCNNIEQTVDTALQQAAALRQSILKQAFEGNL